MRKMLALSENKTRPHQPRMHPPLLPLHGLPQSAHHSLAAASTSGVLSPSPSPGSQRRGRDPSRASHERSHSDTPATLPPVDLSAESSSVTSLSNLPALRKHHATSGTLLLLLLQLSISLSSQRLRTYERALYQLSDQVCLSALPRQYPNPLSQAHTRGRVGNRSHLHNVIMTSNTTSETPKHATVARNHAFLFKRKF
jgi:hypothetical protein